MAVQNPIKNDVWFVKSSGIVHGPFDYHIMLAMKERGRIGAGALVSRDHSTWVPIHTLGGAFAELEGGNSLDAQSASTGEIQYFINVDGETTGPLSSRALQDRIRSGTLAPNDPVWIQGDPNWIAAGSIPDLHFPEARFRPFSWLRANQLLVAGVIVGILCFIVAPSWYVLGLTYNRERQRREAQEALRRNREERITNLIAEQQKLEKERDDLAEKGNELRDMKLRYDAIIESARNRKNERERQGLDTQEVSKELQQYDEDIGECKNNMKINDLRIFAITVKVHQIEEEIETVRKSW